MPLAVPVLTSAVTPDRYALYCGLFKEYHFGSRIIIPLKIITEFYFRLNASVFFS
jgi:hypothetical protein